MASLCETGSGVQQFGVDGPVPVVGVIPREVAVAAHEHTLRRGARVATMRGVCPVGVRAHGVSVT